MPPWETGMKGKAYTRENRKEEVAKIQSGRKVSAVAKEYGIKENTIRNWLSRDTGGRSGEILELSRLRRENEELLRLAGMLTYESETGKENSTHGAVCLALSGRAAAEGSGTGFTGGL